MNFLSLLVTWVAAITPITVSVEGDGYLRLLREGRAVYAKSATLTVLADGRLGTTAGDPVLPTLSVPAGTQSLEIDLEGNVISVGASRAPIGRLVLALFPAGASLQDRGGVLLAADRPKLGNPGEGSNGVTRTGKLSAQLPTTSGQSAIPIATGKARVTARAEAEVSGNTVRLGDLATIEAPEPLRATLAQLDLGDTPAFGVRRVYDRTRIAARLKSAGIPVDSVELIIPASVNVTRRAQTIPHSAFIAAAQKALTENPAAAAQYASDEVAPDFKAPVGDARLVVENVSGLNTSACSIKIAVFVDGKRINSRTVRLTATALPEMIKAGSPVKVRIIAGGALVEMSGIARTAGKVGDQISVEVRPDGAEKTLHLARIIAAGVVEVKL
ncbi:MAG: flagella basal body P-ring formation protein FlgA [Methanoregulaceae archaeon]|nr:flagella basal body P-ring formation protein FlgA [Methanoregulaceae archaeon]